MDKELALLQALWKKAVTMDKPIEIPHKSQSDALRRRFQLYNAVKKVRNNPDLDPELHYAITRCTVSFKKDTNNMTLLLGVKLPDEGLANLAESLGIDVDSVGQPPSEQDQEANASLKALQEKIAGGAAEPQHRVNKYYDRTGGENG